MNQRKGSCDVIQKWYLSSSIPNHCCVPLCFQACRLRQNAYKKCYPKRSVLWDSGQEHWVKAAIEKSSGIQPTLWSHAQWDDTANRKAHSAALFQAPTQQPQRGPDRSICQTQLWRNPASCNISESRHRLTDSFLPDHIHKRSTLTRHYSLSYCAGSSVLGTSGNVFLLTGGGNSGLRHGKKKAKGCKNKQLL